MDILEVIKNRRSIREFLPYKIPEEDIELILDMGRYAPTAGNIQPWKFLILTDSVKKNQLKKKIWEYIEKKVNEDKLPNKEKTIRQDNILKALNKILIAPVIILVFVDTTTYPDQVLYDGALAAQNMMLVAHALGYGSSFQTTFFPEKVIKNYFLIPEQYKLICVLPIGKIAQKPAMPKKKPLNSFIWRNQAN